MAAAGTVNPESYEDYLKGRYLWNTRNPHALEKSIRHFERAIRNEPALRHGPCGPGRLHLTLLDSDHITPRLAPRKAKQAAAKALELDESLAEAHVSLGHADFHELDGRAPNASSDRGIELNPSYATAHYYYANYLLAVGQAEEAMAEAGRARTLDPVSLPAQSNVAMILCLAGRLDQAIEASLRLSRRTRALRPRTKTWDGRTS